MSKRFIAIVIMIAVLITLSSFAVKNSAVRRNKTAIVNASRNNSEILFEKAKSAYAGGNYDRAIRFFRSVVSYFPDSEVAEEALLELAESYSLKKDYAGEKGALKEFVRTFPDSENAQKARKGLERLNMELLFLDIPAEDSISYKINPGDTLAKIAARHNTTVGLIKKANSLESDVIYPGRTIKVNTARFSILVDKSENILTLKKPGGEVIKTYVVSTGENLSTPVGKFKIEEKLVSPTWYKLGAVVQPDSEDYELGTRWMGLSVSGYGIHGTNDASSIGKHITKGCVRMKNEEVEELYVIVPSGTDVTIVE